MDRERARKAFAAYVRPYGMDNPRIALKVVHTNRVSEVCEAIARAEGLTAEDIDLAWLCGLLHDIGRFEQLRRWDTFSDGESAPHALIGVEVLFGAGAAGLPEPLITANHECLLPNFIDRRDNDGLIRTAVALHSDFRLPAELNAREHLFCSIVRDADKVDILRTLQENTVQTILKVSDQAFLDSSFSEEALAAFHEHRCLRRDERHSPADYLLGLVAFVFELDFPESRRYLKEAGYLETFLERPFGLEPEFTVPETKRLYREIAEEAFAALAERTSGRAFRLLTDTPSR